ncbi:hypothetical protein [Opitutus sp. ER46]|uniref:hypothetical protein n=1 Tax=Opitutus sp. ER46 TaxID=2161864 RepID=UPI0011B23844|nr:hypothetical protein [Opitutus sp. ER46]
MLLLTIQDTFDIAGRGLVLLPDFSVPFGGWQNRTDTVSIVAPNGSTVDADAALNLTHFVPIDKSMPPDRRWRVVMMLPNVERSAVPVGSEIFGSAELARAIRGEKRLGV